METGWPMAVRRRSPSTFSAPAKRSGTPSSSAASRNPELAISVSAANRQASDCTAIFA
jgi:hypothetical protein